MDKMKWMNGRNGMNEWIYGRNGMNEKMDGWKWLN